MTGSKLHLLMRRRLTSDGCHFAELGAAARNDQIHHALRTAATWAEFRELLPRGEFNSLTRWTDNGGEFLYDDTPARDAHAYEPPDEQFVTRPEDPFSPEEIPGFAEGDYPLFLETEQDRLLPPEFCSQFGTRVTGLTSGSWWGFPASKAETMRSALEAVGHVVTIEIDTKRLDGSDG